MFDEGEIIAVLMLWLAFMTVVGIYVVRIGLMLREQRILERAYRLRLATLRGRSVREMAGTTEG
jgi:hypothetical protein